jgi:hypothetical protein
VTQNVTGLKLRFFLQREIETTGVAATDVRYAAILLMSRINVGTYGEQPEGNQ